MPLVYDNTRTANKGGGWIERADLNDWITRELPQLRTQQATRYQDSKRRWGVADKIAMGVASGVLSGGAGAAFAGGAGGAIPSFATEGIGFSSAGGSMASGVPWLKLAEIGVGTGMDLWGQRNANKANDRATRMDLDAQAYYRTVLERQAALDEQRFNADEDQRRLDRVASEDERAYTRTLSEGRERRRGPYRAVGQAALMSLADIANLRPRY